MTFWTPYFARGGERSKSGLGASTRRSGSPATTAPPAAAGSAAAPTRAALLVSRGVTRDEVGPPVLKGRRERGLLLCEEGDPRRAGGTGGLQCLRRGAADDGAFARARGTCSAGGL